MQNYILSSTLIQTSWAPVPSRNPVCFIVYQSQLTDSIGILKHLLENCTFVLLHLPSLVFISPFFPSFPPNELRLVVNVASHEENRFQGYMIWQKTRKIVLLLAYIMLNLLQRKQTFQVLGSLIPSLLSQIKSDDWWW